MLCYSTFLSYICVNSKDFTFYKIFCNVVFYKGEKHLFFLNLSTSDSQNSYSVTYQAIGRLLLKKYNHQNITFPTCAFERIRFSFSYLSVTI